MEFVRVKYANNKLINANLKEHREILTEYIEKKGYTYLGFIPVLFGPSGKTLALDLIFEAPENLQPEVKRGAKPEVNREIRRETKPIARREPKQEPKREVEREPKKEPDISDLFLDDQQAITAELLGLDD